MIIFEEWICWLHFMDRFADGLGVELALSQGHPSKVAVCLRKNKVILVLKQLFQL